MRKAATPPKVARAAAPKAKAVANAVATTRAKAAPKRGAKTSPPRSVTKPAGRASTRAVRGRTPLVRANRAAVVRFAKVRELDPWARCGPRTSVEQLFRVDEQVDGRAVAVHLVFYDQRGWYCVHGRGCAAVADVHRELRAQRRSVAGSAPATRAAGR